MEFDRAGGELDDPRAPRGPAERLGRLRERDVHLRQHVREKEIWAGGPQTKYMETNFVQTRLLTVTAGCSGGC